MTGLLGIYFLVTKNDPAAGDRIACISIQEI